MFFAGTCGKRARDNNCNCNWLSINNLCEKIFSRTSKNLRLIDQSNKYLSIELKADADKKNLFLSRNKCRHRALYECSSSAMRS